jgi:copper transport protein
VTVFGSVVSAPIDDFLAEAGGSSATGERLETIGAGLALGGVVLAVGVVVFLAVVHLGRRAEVARLLRLVVLAGALVLGGGIIEVAGTADVLGLAWSEALTDGSASSAMMRLLAGLMMVLGFAEETVPVGGPPIPPGEASTGDELDGDVRWLPGASSAFGLAGSALGVLSFAFDGHTATEGPRLVHATVNVVHVVAGGVWFGGVVGLFAVGSLRRPRGSVALIARFSRVATISLASVFAAGVVMAAMILDGPGELSGTDWGRRLLVKTAAVGAAALLGGYHHLVVVPRLVSGDVAVERTARRTIAAEAAVLVFVVVMSALLTRASTS